MYLFLLCFLGHCLAGITIEVEPVRGRNDDLCLRVFLEDLTTVVDVETDPYVKQQSLGIRITDEFGLFIEKMVSNLTLLCCTNFTNNHLRT